MDIHELRKDIDKLIFKVEEKQNAETTCQDYGRAMSLVRTKLQEAKMWAGKMLEAEGKPFPKELRDHCDERAD